MDIFLTAGGSNLGVWQKDEGERVHDMEGGVERKGQGERLRMDKM